MLPGKVWSEVKESNLGGLLLRIALAVAACSLGQLPCLYAQSVQFGVAIPMRDGVQLSADIWMPTEGDLHPAILVRTPYGKTNDFDGTNLESFGPTYAKHGYVFVLQDVRGRGDSHGNFDFFFQEGHDGFDSVEWIAKQSWSNGKVGMLGLSYLGTVQWLAARERPPHLVCIAPTTPGGRYFDELPYVGGAFELDWALHWLNGAAGQINQNASEPLLNWKQIYSHRPILTMDEAMGRPMRLYREFLEHDTIDDYWKRILFTPDAFRAIDIPTLTTTGWFDWVEPGALSYWRGMQGSSPARNQQYLVIGPWTHMETFFGGHLKVGGFEFTPDSIINNGAMQLAFFEHFLKETGSVFDQPHARIYVTGINRWFNFDQYPPAEVQPKKLYLHSLSNSNDKNGGGSLSWAVPNKDETPDQYTYDPKDPISAAAAGTDQRNVEQRNDVLLYSSQPLTQPLEIIGPVAVHLTASSDAQDTDFVAKLIDVFPDGRALSLGPRGTGVIRARYRNGYTNTELLVPGKPETFQIVLFDVGHVFLTGHRIRLEIESSAFPYINPNQNTGNPIATDTEWKIAHQNIFHDSSRTSFVLLPVMPSP
jgi:uncharacterized protein